MLGRGTTRDPDMPSSEIEPNQAGFAPLVPHFTYLPLLSRQRVGCAGFLAGHLMNFPFESRQGAAAPDGADAARRPSADNAMMTFCILILQTHRPDNHLATPP